MPYVTINNNNNNVLLFGSLPLLSKVLNIDYGELQYVFSRKRLKECVKHNYRIVKVEQTKQYKQPF